MPDRLVRSPAGPARIVVDEQGHEVVLHGDADVAVEPALGTTAPFAVYVPYVRRHPKVAARLPNNATYVYVGASRFAYCAALADWWARGETFAVVEHDIVCHDAVWRRFEACHEPWCVFKRDDYCHPECQEAWASQLSTTRFRAELIAQVPDAVTSIPEYRWGWENLCDGLADNLRKACFGHHWHEPEVHHLPGTCNPGSANFGA
jgi:hypothetical protein